MRPRYTLFILPLLLLGVFGCKKSDVDPPKKAKVVMGVDDESTQNVRVVLSTPPGGAPYAQVDIVPGWDPSAPPFESRPVSTSSSTVTLLHFTVLPGTYYFVRVIDQTGAHTYSTPITATTDMATYRFPVEAPVPPLPPPTPPVTIPSTPDTPDTPGAGTHEFLVKVGSSPLPIVTASIMTPDYMTVIKTKTLIYDSASNFYYKRQASFQLAPGTTFTVVLTDESGGKTMSSQIVAPNYDTEMWFY